MSRWTSGSSSSPPLWADVWRGNNVLCYYILHQLLHPQCSVSHRSSMKVKVSELLTIRQLARVHRLDWKNDLHLLYCRRTSGQWTKANAANTQVKSKLSVIHPLDLMPEEVEWKQVQMKVLTEGDSSTASFSYFQVLCFVHIWPDVCEHNGRCMKRSDSKRAPGRMLPDTGATVLDRYTFDYRKESASQ